MKSDNRKQQQSQRGGYAVVIPNSIIRIIADQTLIIFDDSTQTRDLVIVDDVVKAILLCAMNKTTGESNVVNAKGIMINTFAEIIVDMNN
ncbi:MAG: NAD-dependent epimerase/dehydratase family protein [Thermoplasmatota archaeon]